MRKFLRSQIDEISNSRGLRLFGAALGGTLIATAIAWWSLAPGLLNSDSMPICWPQFSLCADIRHIWVSSAIHVCVAFIGFFGLATVASMVFGRVGLGYTTLVLGTVAKTILFIQDYRFMGNYHYMPFWLIAIYLLIPNKRTTLPWMMVAFYVSAGALKFNEEWLSGATLLRESFLPAELIKPLLLYAIIQECVIVFGLVSRHRWVFRFAFANFIAFHLFSWHIVGWYYPVNMFLLLSLFPLLRKEPQSPTTIESLFKHPRTFPKTTAATLALFAILNIYPHILPGEASLTGNGRMLGLNMLDAMPTCRHHLYLHYTRPGSGEETVEWTDELKGLAPRIKCDPIVFWNLARNLCRSESQNSEFKSLDMNLISKRQTDPAYRKIFSVQDFCRTGSPPSIFLPTSWVVNEPENEILKRELPDRRLAGPSMGNIDSLQHLPASTDPRMFREDAERTGVSHDPTSVNIRKAKILWRRPIANVGIHSASKASPTVDASGVYVGSDSSWFFKFGHDGELIWKDRLGPADRGIHSTAALDDERVYVGNYAGTAYALDKKDGHIIWSTDLGDTIGSSFLLSGDALYASIETFKPNGFLIKLDRQTGRTIWVSPLLGEQGHSSPALHAGTKYLYAGFNNFLFYAIDSVTGRVVWTQQAKKPIKSTPLIYKNHIIVSANDGWLRSFDAKDGTLLWQTKLSESELRSSPTLESGNNSNPAAIVTSGKGEIFSVEISTGKIRWKKSSIEPSLLIGSALSVQTEIGVVQIFGCENQSLCAFDGSGKRVSTWKLEGPVTGQPAHFRSFIYAVEDAYGERSGDLVKIGEEL